MEKVKSKKVMIGSIVVAIIVIVIVSLIVLGKGKSNSDSNSNAQIYENSESSKKNDFDFNDWSEKVKNIKLKTNNGILYEDDQIMLTTFNKEYGEYEESDDYVFELTKSDECIGIEIEDIYIINKSNDEFEYKMEKATMNNLDIHEYDSFEVDPGDYDFIKFSKILYAEKVLNSMGIGALNNIKLEMINEDDEEAEPKIINLETNCQVKSKDFSAENKLYDKDGIKIYMEEKYISDNTDLGEKVKEKILEENSEADYLDDTVIQNDPLVRLIVENKKDKEITIEVTAESNSNKEIRVDGSMFGKTEKIKIQSECIDMIYVDNHVDNFVKKEQAYNPNDVKYIFKRDGKEIFTIDFKNAQLK